MSKISSNCERWPTDEIIVSPSHPSIFYSSPPVMCHSHWHAQVEVNFAIRGWADCQIRGRTHRLNAGELCLFWGGFPHSLPQRSDDFVYAGGHLPLVHFFRLRLPGAVQNRLMRGAMLLTRDTDEADPILFQRLHRFAASGDREQLSFAIDELLMRLERIRFGQYELVSESEGQPASQKGNGRRTQSAIVRLCEYIAENFREEIDAADVGAYADMHPKYAMTLFKKNTGMTLNEYIKLMRLSYAQARLLGEDAPILDVAMDSGFGCVSTFNKAFKAATGTSPGDFRRRSLDL